MSGFGLGVTVAPRLDKLMEQEFLAGEKAVTRTMGQASSELKLAWRGQITGAGLGKRLGNSVRSAKYPASGESMNAAAMVWSKAPHIVDSFDRGSVIRAKSGFFLAIPTDAAGKGRGGARITPAAWEARTGMQLRYVPRKSGHNFLVADDARLNKRQVAVQKRGKRRKSDGILSNAQTVPIFTLVPQVRLPQKLDLDRDASRIGSRIPGMIVDNWLDQHGFD